MKILICSDLHGKWSHYAWLAEKKVDLIVIAGDLIDMLSIIEEEVVMATAFLATFKSPVVVCPGNHDHAEVWFPALVQAGVMIEGTHELHGITVTSLPWDNPLDEMLAVGKQAAKKSGNPWLIAHHDPPREVFHAEPDFVACGHWHEYPYDKSFIACYRGKTLKLNAGVRLTDWPEPNHIILDLDAKEATWHAENTKTVDID